MADGGRKLEGLSKDDLFLTGLAEKVLSAPREARRRQEKAPVDEIDALRKVLSVAVHDALRARGLRPRPFVPAVTGFLDSLYLPAQLMGSILKRLNLQTPLPGSQVDVLRRFWPSVQTSVEEQRPDLIEELIGAFQLRLLAELLTLAEEALFYKKESQMDPLTQLLNRRGMEVFLEGVMRPGRKGGLSFLDIDKFHDFNDKWTHNGGDEALAYLAEILSEMVRDVDAVVRYGGEELMIIFPDMDREEDLRAIAERIRNTVKEASRDVLKKPFTVSQGGVVGPLESLEDVHRLISNADARVFMAKDRGRDLAIVGPYDPGLKRIKREGGDPSTVPEPSLPGKA
jgi:diguanylate cyclase (GGDEF)-like protein